MILQSLVKYYERQVAQGDDAMFPEGWIRRPIDYVAVIRPGGECVHFEPAFQKAEGKRGGVSVLLPAIGKQALKHSNSGRDANLLWDNASFVLGRGKKGALKLESFISTIDACLPGCDDIAIEAVRSFCKNLKDNVGGTRRLIEKFGLEEDFKTRDPLIAFRLFNDAMYVHNRPAIRAAYERKRSLAGSDLIRGTCLVTGAVNVPIAKNEIVIKGVWGAQTTGANIVSFNGRAFESYGKRNRQGENAPIGQSASFAYTTALNDLLRKDSPQRVQVGKLTTIFWADRPTELETRIAAIFGEPDKDDPDRDARALARLSQSGDEGETKFFALGLAPNGARLAVCFWHNTAVSEMAKRIRRHFEDLAIERTMFDPPYPSLFRILAAVSPQGKIENVPSNLCGELMQSILGGLPYPRTLLAAALRRVCAEPQVTYPRAALIKACINRAARSSHPGIKEELKMSLEQNNTNIGYRLGRLFAVLEKVQEEAAPGIHTTIRDRFYGMASSTPATVFSTLLKLKNHQLSKLDNRGRAANLERLIGEIIDPIDHLPAQLPMADQGRFAIGYYHQRLHFFKKGDTSPQKE